MPSILPTATAVAESQKINLSTLFPLRPVLIGPKANLHRYAQAAEKPGILLGNYNFLVNAQYAWPSRDATSIIDLPYAKVWLDNCELQYFNHQIGNIGVVAPVSGYTNRIRHSSVVFSTANGVSQSAVMMDRGVKVGDAALVSGTVAGTLYSLWTTITGFAYEVIAAVVGAATSGSNNKTTQGASVSISQVVGTPANEVVAVASGTSYKSLADGYITRTYKITVTQSSTGGSAPTALLSVVSADGLDNQVGVVPAAFGSPTSIGTKGLTVTFSLNAGFASSTSGYSDTDLVIGQQWTCTVNEVFTAPSATSGGSYAGPSNTGYIVSVLRGGLYTDVLPPLIVVSTTTGIDTSGPTSVTASATPVVVGTQSVTVQFNQVGLCGGDTYNIPCTAATPGGVQTLILSNDLTSATSSTGVVGSINALSDVNLTLFIKKQGFLFPQQRTYPTLGTNWTTDQVNLYLTSGAYAFDPTWTLLGVQQPLPIYLASVYAEYREWVFELAGPTVQVTTLGGVASALGTVDPDNPIAWAAYKALQNTGGALLNSTVQPTTNADMVQCAVLGGDPSLLATWQTALNSLQGLSDAYYLVPLTQLASVQAAVASFVVAQSQPGVSQFLACLLSPQVTQSVPIVTQANTSDSNVALATLAQNPASLTTSYTLLTVGSGNTNFITNGVNPGDIVRFQYTLNSFGQAIWSSYTVLQVISQGTLLLTTGPTFSVTTPQRVEVWRALSSDQVVAQVAAQAAVFHSNRVCLVWPDTVVTGGVTVPGYFLCAAIAGLAGSVPSQQGLRHIQLQGIDSVPRSSAYLNSQQRSTLATAGVFVVNLDPATGDVYVGRANTTDPTSVNSTEEMIRRNTDMVASAIEESWADLIGTANINSALFQLMRTRLNALTNNLLVDNNVASIGSPVNSITLISLGQDPNAQDHVIAVLAMTGPTPNNLASITITLV